MVCRVLFNQNIWLSFLLFLTSLFITTHASIPSSSYSVVGDSGTSFDIAVNVPSPNQNDDIYFCVSAPGGQTWVAFGFGGQMAGSLIFVLYPSEDGKNVTVSPRLGKDHEMPIYTSIVTVDLLAGSGILDGNYVVNAKCTGCRNWDGGNKININSTSQSMIWAVASDGILQTNDLDATIHQHSDHGFFNLNMVQATGQAGVPSGNAGGSTGGPVDEGMDPFIPRAIHGVLMVGTFLIVFPSGFMFLRIFERVWVHWVIQSLGVLGVILGAIAGISLSIKQSISPKLNAPHQIVGLVVVALALITWFAGFFGHRMYKKTGSPAPPMKAHRFLGPATVSAGLINCAVGFHFAQNNHAIIGFIIFTTLMIIFVSSILFFVRRRRMRRQAMNTPAAQNFRQGQMEPQYAGVVAAGDTEQGVPLQPYGRGRPQSQTLPSYHSDGGYPEEHPPRI